MCHTRAPSAARRARAREWRDGLGLDCDRGRAEPRFRRFACSSDVGRHASRTRPVHGPVRPNSRYTSVYPKNRPARCVACTRAEHSRAVRTRVHNDRITIRRVTLTRAVAGIAVYVCTADRHRRGRACMYRYVFTPGDRDRYRVRARGWRQARTRRRDTRPCDAVPKRRGFDAATPAHPPPRVMAGFF